MKILFVASECWPLVKIGGLADVAGSLSKALRKIGIEVEIALPFYEAIEIDKTKLKLAARDLLIDFEGRQTNFSLWKTYLPESKVPVFLIENEKYFGGKNVYLEKNASSGGSQEEAARFLFLCASAAEIAGLTKADVIHSHDWHAGLTPFLAKRKGLKAKNLFTIHNLGYQGIYPSAIVNHLLDADFKTAETNCLKVAIEESDLINTVSPTYSKEILTKEFGWGLEKDLLKRKQDLSGILNGLDPKFSPEKDPFLKKNYSAESLQDKEENKTFLQKKCFGKANPKIPLMAIISRLAYQKGFNLLEKTLPKLLLKRNFQFVLLGQGEEKYEKFFLKMMSRYPGKCWAKITFDERLAHQIYAGSDIFLMPSLYEPCGLGQQIAMKYGSVPVGRATGGIKDTVSQAKIERGRVSGTGFLFERATARSLYMAINKALRTYQYPDVWKKIQLRGMSKDVSWSKSALEYKKLYERMLSYEE